MARQVQEICGCEFVTTDGGQLLQTLCARHEALAYAEEEWGPDSAQQELERGPR